VLFRSKAVVVILVFFLSLFCNAQSGSSAGGILGGNTWAKRGVAEEKRREGERRKGSWREYKKNKSYQLKSEREKEMKKRARLSSQPRDNKIGGNSKKSGFFSKMKKRVDSRRDL